MPATDLHTTEALAVILGDRTSLVLTGAGISTDSGIPDYRGLHELAGHRDVIDLHGLIDRVICLSCREVSTRQVLHRRLSVLNPGQTDRLVDFAPDGDAKLVDAAESLLVLGSSLQVMSGLRFVRQARKPDKPVVIVNRGSTRRDDFADLKLEAGCAETLANY